MLKDTLEWRRANRVDDINLEDFRKEAGAGWMYLAGWDAHGRPVMMMRKRTSRLLPEQIPRYFQFLTFTMEALRRAMDRHPDASPDGKWVWLLDQRNYNAANAPRLSTTYQTLSMLSSHYPESLHRCYIVGAPTVFSRLFRALTPFLDAITAKKVEFVEHADLVLLEAAAAEATSLAAKAAAAATGAAPAPAPASPASANADSATANAEPSTPVAAVQQLPPVGTMGVGIALARVVLSSGGSKQAPGCDSGSAADVADDSTSTGGSVPGTDRGAPLPAPLAPSADDMKPAVAASPLAPPPGLRAECTFSPYYIMFAQPFNPEAYFRELDRAYGPKQPGA